MCDTEGQNSPSGLYSDLGTFSCLLIGLLIKIPSYDWLKMYSDTIIHDQVAIVWALRPAICRDVVTTYELSITLNFLVNNIWLNCSVLRPSYLLFPFFPCTPLTVFCELPWSVLSGWSHGGAWVSDVTCSAIIMSIHFLLALFLVWVRKLVQNELREN